METRSFQYTDAKSNKFWTITLEGSSHTVSYGRIGASGKTETKTFSTKELAKQSYEKLIQQKLSKGYIEVNQDTQPVVENTVEIITEQQDREVIETEVKSTGKLESITVSNAYAPLHIPKTLKQQFSVVKAASENSDFIV